MTSAAGRDTAGDSTRDTSRDPARDTALVAEQTERLLETARCLPDGDADSLCEGWSRGHVLTHVARNAEAIGRLATWAVTGTPEAMYPGGRSRRDADIEAGARRAVADLVDDVAVTAQALAPLLDGLTGPWAAQQVEMRGGLMVSPAMLPFLRLREVVYHHVDLAAGYGFADVPADLLRDFVEDAVGRLRATEGAPAVELRADEGDEWTLGRPTASVRGSLSALLLWLARRDPSGLRVDGNLPELPRGA
jgi:maleylpyruvate isomerase